MKTEIVLEKLREPRCIIYTPKVSQEISLLRDYIENFSVYNPNEYISAWDGDYCVKLHEKDIYRVFSYDKKVYAETIKDTLVLKLRLYQFEELVSEKKWDRFIRISNTDIVNIEHVEKFDLSFTGIITVVLKNGTRGQVSRRYMKKIREKILKC